MADSAENLQPGATLAGVDVSGANLLDAVSTDATLTGIDLVGGKTGVPCYDASMNRTKTCLHKDTTSFYPVFAGWTRVPEPFAAILAGLGLVVSATRRQT